LVGAILAFYRARYMMRDLILLFAKRFPIIRAADRALERNGWRVMLLLRLCPIIPFHGLNYIGGVLSVSVQQFAKSMVGIVPMMLLWIYCGASSQILGQARLSGTEEVGITWMILLGSGTAFGIIGLVLIWKFAIKELTKEIAKDSAENWFRYKKHHDDFQAGSDESEADELQPHQGDEERTASRRIVGIELSLEEEEDRRSRWRRTSIMPYVGIDTHRLDDQMDPLENDEDEEWFWLFA
jgi:hypothetical protein